MGSAPAVLFTQSALLRRVWSDPSRRVRFTRHASEEMAKDNIIEADVRHVLARNGVCWIEWKQDEIWHVEGDDIDGRSIRVVLALHEVDSLIKIVTVMAL